MSTILIILMITNFLINYILGEKLINYLSPQYKNKKNYIKNRGFFQKKEFYNETGQKILKILNILSFIQFILFVLFVIVQVREN